MASSGREFFTVKTVAQALHEFRPSHLSPVETVAVDRAYGRIASADIRAREALPGFDRSSVDGFAVRARDTFGASDTIPAYLQVTGTVRMGAAADDEVRSQTAIAVPTGGMLPDGADAVVMIEHTQPALPGTIEVIRPVAPGEGIVRSDEDVAPGATIVRSGRPLRAQEVAMVGSLKYRCTPPRGWRSSPQATRSSPLRSRRLRPATSGTR
jgi:molybdopterin molybdotransferase